MQKIKTKSQMIMQIAELSEQNTLLREELYKKSEQQESIDALLERIKYLEDRLQLRIASDKESDEFWDEIFSAKDYPFNKENAYKELSDYYFVLEQLPSIYMEITGGTLSKTTYFASSVIQAHNDCIDRHLERIDDLEYALNQIEAIANCSTSAPCLDIDCDCDNCNDECSNNGNYCMQKGLEQIKSIISEVLK